MSISNNYPNVRPSLLLDFANTRTLDPRITFTRASTGTFYDGKTVAKAEENLLLQSQSFATTSVWTASSNNSVVTANTTTAPDGTTTASTISDVTATSTYYAVGSAGVVIPNVATTVSVYLKTNTAQFAYLGLWDGTTYNTAVVDLTGGTVTSTGGSPTSTSITSVGSGWYRVSVTKTINTTTFVLIGTSNSGTPTFSAGRPVYSGTGALSVYAWGAQLEQRSTVTAYTATTTAPITNYIPALQTAASGVARFDHNPTTGESLGLLIEEQRTNLLTYSSGFDNAAWTKLNTTITADTIVAPDGTQTGDKIIASNAAGGKVIYQTVSAGTVTASVYAKAGEMGGLALAFGPAGTWFNLTTGAIRGYYNATPTSSTITPVGNGWYRCSITVTLASADGLYIGPNDNVSNSLGSTLTGNGFSGIYIWGAQLEAGSFATSYIPTVASQVTRSQDTASIATSSFGYRIEESTIFARLNMINPQSAGTRQIFMADSIHSLALDTASVYGSIPNVGNLAVKNFSYTVGTSFNIVSAFKREDSATTANGSTVATATNSPAIKESGTYRICSNYVAGTQTVNGTIAKLAYYPKRLTNAELQGLTTI